MKKYNVVYRREGETEIDDPEFVDVVLPWYLFGFFHHCMSINKFRLIWKFLEDD